MIFLLRRLWHTRRLKDHQDIPAFNRKMIEEFAEGVAGGKNRRRSNVLNAFDTPVSRYASN
jgi:hypothetical protein